MDNVRVIIRLALNDTDKCFLDILSNNFRSQTTSDCLHSEPDQNDRGPPVF